MINPCGEIPLGEKTDVLPWMQVMLMNYFRYKKGLPSYTPAEREQILKELESKAHAQDIQVPIEDTREAGASSTGRLQDTSRG